MYTNREVNIQAKGDINLHEEKKSSQIKNFALVQDRLSNIMKRYQEVAKSDPIILREKLSSKEIWRFFIEGIKHEHGRGLGLVIEDLQKNKFPKTILDYTVTEYAEKIEGVDWFYESSLRKSFSDYHWHFSDEECAKVTLRDIQGLDRGWIPFEINEPGYLQALYGAFNEIFKENHLTIEYLTKLNRLATKSVSDTLYRDDDIIDQKGKLRVTSDAGFGLKVNITVNGIKELLEKNSNYNYFYIYYFKNRCGININQATIEFLGKNFHKLYSPIGEKDLNKQDQYDLWKVFLNLYSDYSGSPSKDLINEFQQQKELKNLAFAAIGQDNQMIAQAIFAFITNNNGVLKVNLRSRQKGDTQVTLEKTINCLFEKYNAAAIENATLIEKLFAVVKLTLSLEQLHPFIDANCRTICMVLFNDLLKKHGFPLAILDDPNRFGGYSSDELLIETLKGMENTLDLIENGELFNVKTDDILKFLANRKFTKALQYFNDVLKIAEKNSQEDHIKVHSLSGQELYSRKNRFLLLDAIKNNDEETVHSILPENTDALPLGESFAPLYSAINKNSNLDIFKLIWFAYLTHPEKNEINWTKIKITLLEDAIKINQYNIVEFLLGQGVQPNNNCLNLAAKNVDQKLLKLILSHNVSIKECKTHPLLDASSAGNLDNVKFLLNQCYPSQEIINKAFANAIYNRKLKTANFLFAEHNAICGESNPFLKLINKQDDCVKVFELLEASLLKNFKILNVDEITHFLMDFDKKTHSSLASWAFDKLEENDKTQIPSAAKRCANLIMQQLDDNHKFLAEVSLKVSQLHSILSEKYSALIKEREKFSLAGPKFFFSTTDASPIIEESQECILANQEGILSLIDYMIENPNHHITDALNDYSKENPKFLTGFGSKQIQDLILWIKKEKNESTSSNTLLKF